MRYARCCQNLTDFRERTLKLVERLKKQGFKFGKLCQTFTKFARKCPHLLKKYREFQHHDLDILLRSGDGKKHLPTALKGLFLTCYHFWLVFEYTNFVLKMIIFVIVECILSFSFSFLNWSFTYFLFYYFVSYYYHFGKFIVRIKILIEVDMTGDGGEYSASALKNAPLALNLLSKIAAALYFSIF